MDARQIAALARAGLTDEQIDTVVRVTKTTAPAPEPEPEPEPAPAPRNRDSVTPRPERFALKPNSGQVTRTSARRLRGQAVVKLCEAIRSDVVRAGGQVTAPLAKLSYPHRQLLDATCFGLDRTTNIAFSQYISARLKNGAAVVGGLRFQRGKTFVGADGFCVEWTVTAV